MFSSGTPPADKAPAIGIDLGTSYSSVAVFMKGKAEVIANNRGNKMTPSYVAYANSERLTGESAKFQTTLNPLNTVYGTNRIIGQRFEHPACQSDMKYWPFKVVNEG